MKRSLLTKAVVFVLVCGVVTGVALFFRQRGSRVQAASSWRSLEHPPIDTAPEEYAVYSAVLDQLHAEKRLWRFVIRDHTLPCARSMELCDYQKLKHQVHPLDQETLDDYITRNQTSFALSKFSTLNLPVELLSDSDLRGMLVKTNRPVDLASIPSRKIYWSLFYDRYDVSPGLVSFSQVGFNAAMDQALVYEEMQANDNGTWARYLLLTREADANSTLRNKQPWVIKDKIEKWLPEEPPPSIRQNQLGTLKGRILDAKEEGLNEVELHSILCGWDIGSLRAALARDTLMLAEVVGKKTIANDWGLITWYKFKIVDTISQKPFPKHFNYWSPEDPPQDLQPVGVDEFVIAETNGQMDIDGVSVTQYSNSAKYLVGNNYLIFLYLHPAKRVAVRAGTDPLGVFLVGKDGTFSPYLKQPYPLQEQMAKRFGNSIENVRRVLQN